MNYIFVAGDVISKCFIIVLFWGWTYIYGSSYEWCITNFSISAITNSIILGSVVMRAMYGSLGEELVIQSAVLQLIIWLVILLFMLEVRRARQNSDSVSAMEMSRKDLEENSGVEEIYVSAGKPSGRVLMKTVFGKLAKNPNCLACIAGFIWALFASRYQLHVNNLFYKYI